MGCASIVPIERGVPMPTAQNPSLPAIFDFDGRAVRIVTDAQGVPWFVAKEIADVLGYSDAFEITKKLDDDERQNLQIAGFGPRGVTIISESGVYAAILGSQKPGAKRFKRWVRSEVLPAIRRTGAYTAPRRANATYPEVEALRLVPTVTRAARALGLDKNAASISADQAVRRLTGCSPLALLGVTHLPAEQQEQVFTPTELGQRIGMTAQQVNMLLADAGLQVKVGGKGGKWEPLPAAKGLYRVFDTGKHHGDGTMVQQVKWFARVLDMIPAGLMQ